MKWDSFYVWDSYVVLCVCVCVGDLYNLHYHSYRDIQGKLVTFVFVSPQFHFHTWTSPLFNINKLVNVLTIVINSKLWNGKLGLYIPSSISDEVITRTIDSGSRSDVPHCYASNVASLWSKIRNTEVIYSRATLFLHTHISVRGNRRQYGGVVFVFSFKI